MTMKKPANVVDLIDNLLNAFKKRLVFDETFYTEDNIKQLTAAKKIKIVRQQKNPILRADASGFWTIDNQEPDDELLLTITLEIQSNGKKSVIIDANIDNDQPALHYFVLEKMVGHDWHPCEPEPLDDNHLYEEADDPHGNIEMEYFDNDGKIDEEGFFAFNSIGLLNSLFLRGEEQ